MTDAVLVTGATGLVGRALVGRLHRDGSTVVATARRQRHDWPADVRFVPRELASTTDWGEALRGCDRVIHCAARVHVMDERAADPDAEFRRVNVDGTLALARQALAHGVRRFVFVSSAKVLGEVSPYGRPFDSDSPRRPVDAYARSKAAAEEALESLTAGTGMSLSIVRPPLVYGPGVGANFATLIRWLRRGVPLPFGAITHNRRSLVALPNLVDLISVAASHPLAGGLSLLAADAEDLSTRELLVRTAAAMGCRARLIHVPPSILRSMALTFGHEALWQRLGESLQLDTSSARDRLGWSPPVSVDEGLRQTVASGDPGAQR